MRPWQRIALAFIAVALFILLLLAYANWYYPWPWVKVDLAMREKAGVEESMDEAPAGYEYSGLPECALTDVGADTPLNDPTRLGHAKWLFSREGNLWEINLHEASGCNLVFEGRIVPGEELHRVIVLRSSKGENPEYVKDGKFLYAEGSIWELARNMNVEDVNSADPVAMKLVNDKRAVMDANNYDWPIVVSLTDGSEMTFGPGTTWDGLTEENHCDFSDPVKINVHGEYLSDNQFAAAVGATNCVTVAWINGADKPIEWMGQRDAADKVVYKTIDAWLMPSSWEKSQIDSWVLAH